MARRMLFEVAGERPGADLMEAPRTVPLPLALVGITVAALAEAMQVRAANEPPGHLGDVIATYAQVLSGLGQITADAAPEQAGNRQRSCSRQRCCAVRPGTSAAPPTWPRTAADSRPGFPRRHAASWPLPCAEMLTD